MQIELTVRDPAGSSSDIAIRVPAPVPFGAVAPLVRRAIGAPTSCVAAGMDEVVLGSPGLVTGSTVTFAARASEQVAPAPGHHPSEAGLAVQVVGGRDAGRTLPIAGHGVTVGRAAHCDLVLHDDAVSREHAVFRADVRAATVLDNASTNGTFVEGGRLTPHTPSVVRPGDLIRVGDSLLTVHAASDDTATLDQGRPTGAADAPVVIELTEPPRRTRSGPVHWVAIALPALAGCGLAWATHSAVFLLFALLSPLTVLATTAGEQYHRRRDDRRDGAALRRQRGEQEDAVADALLAETVDRRARHPDPVTLARRVAARHDLWQPAVDAQSSGVRVASADLRARVRVRENGHERSAGLVRAVPLVVDLRTGVLGLAGSPHGVTALARWLIAQVAVARSPTDLALVLLLGDDYRAAEWSWMRWLPHLAGRVATGTDEWLALLDDVAASAPASAVSASVAGRSTLPALHAVALVDARRDAAIEQLADRLAASAATGVAVVVLDSRSGERPVGCDRLFEPGRDANDGVVPDGVGRDWAETVARSLAARSGDAGSGGAPPRRCHLLDVLGFDHLDPAAVVDRWSAGDGRAAVALGTAANGAVKIDLARDGPHVLVAGTTGSGKSELLRSLVLGLALSCPPDEVTFVLVDFKGGAAFADATALPHVVGSVTDLDAQLTRRALRSLDAELKRRERLFRSAGAADLDTYRQRQRGPTLARLIVVVDEFATLADELPDFLRGLVAVAQRGRSLGVHLVLATQRPGTAVTPEIRANTNTRIALRTVEVGESHDVVGVPDAARIPVGMPGRAVLTTGEAPVAFQTAGVDGVPRERVPEAEVVVLGPWRRRPVGRDEMVSYRSLVEAIVSAARLRGVTATSAPWASPLPDAVTLDSLAVGDLEHVPFALLDLPEAQRQDTLALDLAAPSSWLVVGGPRSGRTSALLTVAVSAALRASPAELQIHVLDGGGPLATALRGLPHVATCLGPGELSSATALLRRLAAPGSARGRIVLLGDRVDEAVAGTDDPTAPSLADTLTAVRRAGRCTIVLAGSRDLLVARATAGFDHRLLLPLSDRADYPLAGIPLGDVPPTSPPGRAIRAGDSSHLQFALAGDRRDPSDVTQWATRIASRWSGTAAGRAPRLRPLPTAVTLESLPIVGGRLRLGLAADSAIPLSVDLWAGPRQHLVAGPARSGRTTVLVTLLREAVRVGRDVLVAAPPRSPLAGIAHDYGLPVLAPETTAMPELPARPTLVLVDDCETFVDTNVGGELTRWARDDHRPLVFVVTGRSDELAAAYSGLGAEIRRARCGVLLRPGPLDGDLFDVRVPVARNVPPGRGVLVGESAWLGELGDLGDVGALDLDAPLPIQIALA